MTNGRRKSALITGASSGIGEDFANLFARDGYDLVLIARSEAKLKQIAESLRQKFGTHSIILPEDLSREGSTERIFKETETQKMTIDVLINNAGFGVWGDYATTDRKKELELLQVNIVALTDLTKLYLKGMLERKSGKILNVASTAAFQPGPLMSIYYASKAYVLSYSEAIAEELEGSGVSMSVLCPGPTFTNFSKAADMENSKLFTSSAMTSRAVAEAGYEGLMKGKRIIIPGIRNRVLAQTVRFSPRRLIPKIVKKMQSRRSSAT